MSDYTQTPNYGLLKPIVNADNDVWGDHWNLNADTLDNIIFTIQTTATVKSWNGRTGAVALTNADVIAALPSSASAPIVDGIANAGIAATWSRGDHVHPTDPSRAPLASPNFTGNPTAPTPAPGDADTSIATTAFVQTALGGVPGGAVINPTPPAGNPGALWWDSTGGQLYVRYDDGTSQQWVTAANMEGLANAATKQDVAATQNNVGRNLLHNSLFNIAQRGAGPWTTPQYTADRWAMYFANGTMSTSIIPQNDAGRAAIGDEASALLLQCAFTGSATAGSVAEIYQCIEDVRRLAGKTVTVSFWAWSNAASVKLGAQLDQTFGTGGAPSGGVYGTPQVVTITATPARYSVTYSLPSISGKTLGTAGNSNTSLALIFSSATVAAIGAQSGTVWLWGVQLEIGSTATPLEKPDPQVDLANCQRFFYTGQVLAAGYSGSAIAPTHSIIPPVTMRASPTIVVTTNVDQNLTSPTQGVLSGGILFFQGTTPGTASGWAINRIFTVSADL
jgi:hypothetical protein